MITIIIPVYNGELFLNKCIDSIVQQTFKEWKLILVDDGSKDKSLEICQQWSESDNRITVFSQKNGGPGRARNLGLKNCKSKWVTFVDADDTIDPDYLENFNIGSLKDGYLSVQGYERVDSMNNNLGEEKNFNTKLYDGESIKDAFSQEWFLDYGQTVGKLYDFKTIKEKGVFFPTEFRLSEDHVFFLKVLPYVKAIRFNSGKKYKYIEWNLNSNITSLNFPPKELWKRYIELKSRYEEITSFYNIEDKRVIIWFRQFVFTGSLSLIIQSVIKDKLSDKERQYWIKQIKREGRLFRKNFLPNSLKGKILKYLFMLLSDKTNSIILKKIKL